MLAETPVAASRHGSVSFAYSSNGGASSRSDEKAVRRADELGHAWRSPVWRHDDGSFAEW